MIQGMMLLVTMAAAEQPFFEAEFVFDPEKEDHGHVHASCIVECPNGDLRTVWYENGPALPPPHFSVEKDKSDDVRIGGSRRPAEAKAWEPPFAMADTFGVSDNNPCLIVDAQQRLWLIYATLLGVPQEAWGSALLQYRVASSYDRAGVPRWDNTSILVVHPDAADDTMGAVGERGDAYKHRLGWMPRAHPLIRSDGTLVLPIANENSGLAAMAMTSNGGATWTISRAVPTRGLSQPTVVEYPDGAMTAFFRNSHMKRRIMRSESSDGGMTWTPAELTDLPHPDAGIEAVLLKNGHLAMIYNDTEKERDRLALSISEDRGKTWTWTRHLENTPGRRFDYPSLIQARDGSLHATYSYNTRTVKYVHFDEAWIQAGN